MILAAPLARRTFMRAAVLAGAVLPLALALGGPAAASGARSTFTTQFPGYVGIAVSSPCLPLPRAINPDKNAACSQRYDLNGDGRPEIIARRVRLDGKRTHTFVSVYTQINGRWSKLIEVEGDWLFVSRTKRSQGWPDILIVMSCAFEDEDSPLVCAGPVSARYANGIYAVPGR